MYTWLTFMTSLRITRFQLSPPSDTEGVNKCFDIISMISAKIDIYIPLIFLKGPTPPFFSEH